MISLPCLSSRQPGVCGLPRAHRPAVARLTHSRLPHGLPRPGQQRQTLTIVSASRQDRDSGNAPDEQQHRASTGLSVATRQLLSVSALAFFTLVATVVKDRATSPIVPPFLPPIQTLASTDASSSSSTTLGQSATAIAETVVPAGDATSAGPTATSKTAVKPSRSLLRALWGTATLPVKLVDALLFPEEALVGSKAAKQQEEATQTSQSSSSSSTAAATQPAAAASREPISSTLPAADPAAAAAGQALTRMGEQLQALTATAASSYQQTCGVGTDADSSATATSAASELLSTAGIMEQVHKLQDALARMATRAQGQHNTQQAATATDRSAEGDAAAALAMLRAALGPNAMSLLPVLLVTSATAAAGLMLAMCMSGLAGVFDSRKAFTPGQRAAQAALLDSPLRPICCYTWPGFLPLLPSSINPHYYRFRGDGDGDGVAASSSTSSSSSSSSSKSTGPQPGATAAVDGGSANTAAAAAATAGDEEEEAQEWWSFAQIAALRLMPLLPGSNTSMSDAQIAAAQSASAHAATVAAVRAKNAQLFEQTKAQLVSATVAAGTGAACALTARSNAAIMLGQAWSLAAQLVVVDTKDPAAAWELIHSFGRTAPVQLLADVCCLVPAAAAHCHEEPEADFLRRVHAGDSPDSSGSWEQATQVLAMLLDPAELGAARLQAVCQAMGVLAAAGAPSPAAAGGSGGQHSSSSGGAGDLQGFLQQQCHHYCAEQAEMAVLDEGLQEAVCGEVPDVREWLLYNKQARVAMRGVAVKSSLMAAYTASQLWEEALQLEYTEGLSAAAAGAENPAEAASAAAVGVWPPSVPAWPQPRLALRCRELLVELLQEVPPGDLHAEALHSLVTDILHMSDSKACAAMAKQPGSHHKLQTLQHLYTWLPGPPVTAGAAAGDTTAVAEQHRQIHAALSTGPYLLDYALAVPNCRTVSEEMAAQEGIAVEDVLANTAQALLNGVRVLRPREAAVLWEMRPEWPAAQQLALLDALLLPSSSDELVHCLMESTLPDDGSRSHFAQQFVARTLLLLPAGVSRVREFLAHVVEEYSGGVLVCDSGREDATAICSRLLTGLVVAFLEGGLNLHDLIAAMGLNPAAMAAVVAAAGPDPARGSNGRRAAAAAAAAAGAGSKLQVFANDDLLAEAFFEYLRIDAYDWEAKAGDAVLLSSTVALSLLLHLASIYSWKLCPPGAVAAAAVLNSSTRPAPERSMQFPPAYWAQMAQVYAANSAWRVPGASAAAAVIKACLDESQAAAAAAAPDAAAAGSDSEDDDNDDPFSPKLLPSVRLTDEQYAAACECLQYTGSGGSSSTGSSSRGVEVCYDSWDEGLAALVGYPHPNDKGQEADQEHEDFTAAVEGEALPWIVQVATGRDSDDDSSSRPAGKEDSDSDSRSTSSGSRPADVPEASATASCDPVDDGDDEQGEGQEEEAEGQQYGEEGGDWHEAYERERQREAAEWEAEWEAKQQAQAEAAAAAAKAAAAEASAVAKAAAAAGAAAHDRIMQRVGEVLPAVDPSPQLLAYVEQLAAVGTELGPAWELALYLVVCDSYTHHYYGVGDLLQYTAETAPPRLLAEVIALLPAAAANLIPDPAAAAADDDDASGSSSSSSSSKSAANSILAPLLASGGRTGRCWDTAAGIITELLTPTPAPDDPDLELHHVRDVCRELGLVLYTKQPRSSSTPEGEVAPGHWLQGVLQQHADSARTAAGAVSVQTRWLWGSAKAGQQLGAWMQGRAEQPQRLAEMGVLSTAVASYIAMEVWFERATSSSSSGAAEPQPAVLFSHYELLKRLPVAKPPAAAVAATNSSDSSEDSNERQQHSAVLLESILRSTAAACEYCDELVDPDRSYCSLRSELVVTTKPHKSAPQDVLHSLLNPASCQAFLDHVGVLEEQMGSLLQLPASAAMAAAAGGTGGEEKGAVLQRVAQALVRGQEVVPLPAFSDLKPAFEVLPEWPAAAQLAVLYQRLPRAGGGELLRRFAAAVADTTLARVCALLPAAAANYYAGSAEHMDVSAMLTALTADSSDEAAPSGTRVPALLPHLGFTSAAVSAAVRAAAAEAAPAQVVAAFRAAAVEAEAPYGFIQQLSKEFGNSGPLLYSAVASLPLLLDIHISSCSGAGGSDSVSLTPTATADGSSSGGGNKASPSSEQLSFANWAALAGTFADKCKHDTPGRRAAAALLQQAVLAAHAREQRGALPMAFRQQLAQGLPPSTGYDSKPLKVAPWDTYKDRPRGGRYRLGWGDRPLEWEYNLENDNWELNTENDNWARATWRRRKLPRRNSGGAAAGSAAASKGGAGAAAAQASSSATSAAAGVAAGKASAAAGADAASAAAAAASEGQDDSTYTFADIGFSMEQVWCTADDAGSVDVDAFGGSGGNGGGPTWLPASGLELDMYLPRWSDDTAAQDQGASAKAKGSSKAQQQQEKTKKKTKNAAKKKDNKSKKQQQQHGEKQRQQAAERLTREAAAAVAAAVVEVVAEAEAAADVSSAATAAAGKEDSSSNMSGAAAAGDTATAAPAGADAELVPTVKRLLGLPVDPSDTLSPSSAGTTSSSPAAASAAADLIPNRLALLMCQAMLMRGDDGQRKLQAAVGYLALAEADREPPHLPVMLAGCMEALFATEDWESPSGSARQVLSSLSSALPPQLYMALQKHLMAKGLLEELEVPADF